MVPDYPGHDGYRAATYKYVEYNTGEKELYILAPDPDEMENQASAASQNFLKAASTYLATLKSCRASGCLSAEEAPPPSPVTADFTYAPAQPTDATPVTFTGTGDGVPPYSLTWALGGQPATGETVTRTFPPGTYTVTLTVVDGSGATDTETQSVTVGRSVVIASVKALTSPLRLAVSGTGFHSGCRIAINGINVPNTRLRSRSKVVARGPGLKAMVPKGVPVQMTATNLDSTASAPFTFTR
jgi:PKD repeat protein